jgi:two-component system, cell cycle sensor histidine kinase and response regulator CckA
MEILIVEPSPIACAAIVAAVAELEGLELQQVAEPGEFARRLRGAAPAAVLLSDRPGWEPLGAIRALRAAWPATPLLMIAGAGSEELAVAGMKAGLADYLPVGQLGRLAAALRETLAPPAAPSAAALLAVLEQMPVILNAFDTEYRPVFWNREAERVIGYPADELLGQHGVLRMLYDAETFEQMLVEWQRIGGDFRDWELELITKRGERRVIAWSNLSSSFPVAGWHTWSIGVDVTERRRAEAALRASEARFRMFSELASDFLYEVAILPDGAHRIVWASDTVEQLTGYSVALLCSDYVLTDLFHRDDLPTLLHAHAELTAGRDVAIEARLLTRHGAQRWLRAVNRPLRDPATGVVERYLGACQDVTERRMLIDRANVQAAELSAIFDATPVGLGVYEPWPPYRCLRHNRVKFEMFGARHRERGTAVGLCLDEFLDPAMAADTAVLFEQVLQRGETVFVDEYACAAPGEAPRFFSGSSTPLRDEAGQISAILVASVEITARKKAEEQRLELERALQLAQKVEGLGTLAGGVAHDFNNLLTVIQGNLHLALDELPAGSSALSVLQRAELATRRAADLTAQLLAYAGKGTLYTHPIDLNALVHEMMGLLHTSVPRAVELRLNLAAGLPLASADATQLRQVLMNLVINAGEAIGDAAGVITVSTRERRVERGELAGARAGAELAAGRFVLLQVQDSGPGMDAATIDRIFDPFFSTKFAGRGLGLAAVLGIVRSHGGALTVTSAPGHGACFTLLLPVANAPEVVVAATAPAVGVVLVVDDEPELREFVATAARRQGLRVLTAGDGEEALIVFREHADTIDGVILDLTMPRNDGASAFAQLRALRPELPIVLMSGYSAEETAQRLAGARPTAFLHKPFALRDLLAALRLIVRA